MGLAVALGLVSVVLAGLAPEYKRQMSGGRKTVTAVSKLPGYSLEVSNLEAVEVWVNN